MQSTRNPLDYIGKRQFSVALMVLEKELQQGNSLTAYYYAVAKLGDFFDKSEKNINLNSVSSHYHSLLENKHQKDRPSFSNLKKMSDQLVSIKLLFIQAESAIKPKSLHGIKQGIQIIDKLLAVLQDNKNIREELTKSFNEFKIFYTTKHGLISEIRALEKQLIVNFLLPKPIKELKKILQYQKDDELHLSTKQIDQLYKLQQKYYYTDDNHEIFKLLSKCTLFFYDSFYNKNNDYLKIWQEYLGQISLEKVMLVHAIFKNPTLHPLSEIFSKLAYANLFDDALAIIKNLIYLSNDFWFHIKKIEALIKNNNIENKYELLTILFHFALNNLPYQTSLSPQQFKQYISFVKKQCIHENNVEAKKIYLYLDLLKLIETQDDVFVIQICDMMEEVEISVGNDNFILIAEKILQHQLSIEECIILFNIALQLRQTSVTTLLDLMDKHQNDVTSIKYEMNDTLLKEYQLKYPERPLDEVIRDFLTKSDDVEYPIEAVELKQLENRYLQIKSLGEKLFLTGWLGLQSELTNCHLTLKKEPNNEDAILTLLAIIRLQVMENLKINPYNLQMLNLLALINEPRRIAQIKTGEGKSTLIAMLAAYYGLMRHEVDIITTSADLAVRDAKKFEKFYESLDLSVSHAVNKNTSGFFNDCIVYGTVSDFEFAYLRGETQGKFVGRRNRAYDVAIVDEVDSMFIDMQRNQSILSRSSDEVYSSDIYPCIWHWIENTEIPHKTKENLQAELQSKGFEVPLELANTWLKSARTAQAYSENKEYIIDVAKDEESSCIKIVDKLHTGQIASETTRWQGGLHQILEAKHQLPIHQESLVSGAINHIEYFNKYQILTGVTGTLGSQSSRDELKQLYHVNTYDSPPYRPSLKVQIPHLIESDEKTQLVAIEKMIQQMNAEGRPTLIICEDIQQSQHLLSHLSNMHESVQIYNGMQTLSAEAILSLAGRAKVSTIATNCAGRGTDIVTTDETESKGGLHVIMTFPAINLRVEKQAFGRTGRQGKKGSYHYILREDQLSEQEKKGETIDEKIAFMHANRERREKMISEDNIFYHNLMHKTFILQSIFFELPMIVREDHMLEWAKIRTDMQKLVGQYMRHELDESNDDIVIVNILEKFKTFWQAKIFTQNRETPYIFIENQLKKLIHAEDKLPNEYMKKLFIESLIFLENPKFVFSGEFSDTLIEIRTMEILEVLEKTPEIPLGFSLSRWLHFKVPEVISNILPGLSYGLKNKSG